MTVFRLSVRCIQQVCGFELSWGQGSQLSAELPYPASLTQCYQEWQQAYFKFYRDLALDEPPQGNRAESGVRAQVEGSGSFASTQHQDRRFQLVQAKSRLLRKFYYWLNSPELFDIRKEIAQAARQLPQQTASQPERHNWINVFLTCSSIELERLPWETWEIGAEFATPTAIRLVRTPVNIHTEPVRNPRRGRTRILAIIGDDQGSNFQEDLEVVRQSLSRIAEIEPVGWQPGKNVADLLTKIVAAISDEAGWDVLFFAGHSNETVTGDGRLAIAPNISVSISELRGPLTAAKERGLQFAIFNSCSGLNIAASLIDLGLSQVVVMREPIHNRVAQEFLVQFLQGLAEFQDAHNALLAACRMLETERNLTYPSAYLVLSLFRHPAAAPFRLKPFGLKQRLKQWLPTRPQAIALSILLPTSLLLPMQGFLLEQRVWAQAIFRQVTGQASTDTPPPVHLVQLDEKSIENLTSRKPVDRRYLAMLVDKLSAVGARVVGIDYLLDYHESGEQILAASLREATNRQPQGTWFVFGETPDQTSDEWRKTRLEIANTNWSFQGDMAVYGDKNLLRPYMNLLPLEDSGNQSLPFAYLLALAYRLNFETSYNPPQPQPESQTDFLSQVRAYISREDQQDPMMLFSERSRLQVITALSYWLHQMWLHPIIDFSIPPDQVYERISAADLLNNSDAPQLRRLKHQAIIIAAGGYAQAGVNHEGQDNYALPAAIGYWRNQQTPPDSRPALTGGEVHAYMLHHLLARRLVVPMPDFWMVGIVALLGKGITLALRERQPSQRWGMIVLASTTAIYGMVSLQVYISSAVLLPWLLPSATFWIYVLPELKRRKVDAA